MYSKILVPIDGSATSNAGLTEAIRLAKIHGSQLCIMHIVNELILDSTWVSGQSSERLIESLREGGRDILEAADRIAQAQGIRPVRYMAESFGGIAADLILKQAAEWQADLIVMGTHGRRGLARLAMGSDAEQVVRGATVPVLLIRGPAPARKPASKPASASAA